MELFSRLILITVYILSCFNTASSQLPENPTTTTGSQCFGAGAQLNASCPASSSIALNNIRVGIRPPSEGCPDNATAGDGSNCCVASLADSCEFDFPLTFNKLYHQQCNGRQSCTPGVQNVLIPSGTCDSSFNQTVTQYMYFEHYCVEDSRIGDTNSQQSAEDAALYIHNTGYPTSGIPAQSGGACSVETDNCNAVISVYVIERNLADCLNSTHFNLSQSLSIAEANGSVLANWTCQENTYDIGLVLQSTANYVTVTLTNTMTTEGGKFWIGFKATEVANLTINCPAQDRQYCIPTTTSSTTSTTTTSTSTTPTTTSTSTTTSTTSTTSSTTTSTVTTTSTTTPLPSTTTTTSPTTTTAALIEEPSTSSSTDLTMIIVVCSCIGGCLIITLIIGFIICWRYKKRKDATETDALLDDEEKQADHTPTSSEHDSASVEIEEPIKHEPDPLAMVEDNQQDYEKDPENAAVPEEDVQEESENENTPDEGVTDNENNTRHDGNEEENVSVGDEEVQNNGHETGQEVVDHEPVNESTTEEVQDNGNETRQDVVNIAENIEPENEQAPGEEVQDNGNELAQDGENNEYEMLPDKTIIPVVIAVQTQQTSDGEKTSDEDQVSDPKPEDTNEPDSPVILTQTTHESTGELDNTQTSANNSKHESDDSGRVSASPELDEIPIPIEEVTIGPFVGPSNEPNIETETLTTNTHKKKKKKKKHKRAWTDDENDDNQKEERHIENIPQPIPSEPPIEESQQQHVLTEDAPRKRMKRKKRHKREDNDITLNEPLQSESSEKPPSPIEEKPVNQPLPAVMEQIDEVEVEAQVNDDEVPQNDESVTKKPLPPKKELTTYERTYTGIAKAWFRNDNAVLDMKILKLRQAIRKNNTRRKRKRNAVDPV